MRAELCAVLGVFLALCAVTRVGDSGFVWAEVTGGTVLDYGRVTATDVLKIVLPKALDETQMTLLPAYTVKSSAVGAGDFVPVPVAASVPSGPTLDTMTFVANVIGQNPDPFPDPIADPLGTWEGPLGSSPFAAHAQHYAGRLNVPDTLLALSAQPTITSFLLYALSNATQSALAAINASYATYDFDGRSQLVPGSAISVVEDDTLDADINGIPDDPATIPAATAYVTNSAFNAGQTEVLFANLNNPTNVPNVFTLNGLEIQAPTTLQLIVAGAIAPGANAFLLVKRVDNLSDMPDLIPNFADGVAFAADATGKGTLVRIRKNRCVPVLR